MLPVFVLTFVLAIGLAISPVGKRIAIGIPMAVLINILCVALLSAPTPLRIFMNEPANVWITHAPWVRLPVARPKV